MKKLWVAVAVAAAVAFQEPAQAFVITVEAPGVTSILAPTETFDGESRPLGPAIFNPGGDGGNYLGIGNIVNGSISGVSAAPFYGPNVGDRDTTNYLSIGPGNDPETITYSSAKSFFGLYWGSVDTYNTVDFYLNNVLVNSFTGGNIIPVLANGNQDDFSSNRYVLFTGLDFNKVVLGSSGPPNGVSTPAFEIDNIAAGVPEPATWIIMLIGFAGIGFVTYRRARKGSPAIVGV